jgi:hypothetical protein
MTQSIRNAAIVAVLFLLGACTSLGHIQQTEPVRTTKFTGSHKFVAQCIQQRVGGKVQDESFQDRYVIYDSVKGQENQGLTHFAFTVAKTGPEQGVVEWRVMSPRGGQDPYSVQLRSYANPGATLEPLGTLTDVAVKRYWVPAQECAASAKK